MPRRETQIFNLSMMDVISGAMGAFLIIMIVLMRYYKEDEEVTAQREQLEERLKEIREQIQEARLELMRTTDLDVEELLRRLMALEEAVERAQEEVRRLSSDLQAARNRVNQLEAQNMQLQAMNNQLEQEKQELERRLQFRRAIVVVADWDAADSIDLDLFMEINIALPDTGEPYYFNPAVKQENKWAGVSWLDVTGSSTEEIWLSRNSDAGVEYKVYVALRQEKAVVHTTVTTYALLEEQFHDFGSVTLDASKTWEFLGVLSTDESGRTGARSATEEERRTDRAEVEARMRQKTAEGK